MSAPITPEGIFTFLGYLVAFVGGLSAIGLLIHWITGAIKKKMQYDDYGKQIEALDKKIDDSKNDTTAKLQELNAGMAIMTSSMLAVLDGLQQLNCNGPVTTARDNLVEYLKDAAYDQPHH